MSPLHERNSTLSTKYRWNRPYLVYLGGGDIGCCKIEGSREVYGGGIGRWFGLSWLRSRCAIRRGLMWSVKIISTKQEHHEYFI